MAGCLSCGRVSLTFCAIFFLILNVSVTEYNEKLELLISKIEAGVSFYEKYYKSINLDGLFGLRVIEGELLFLVSQSEYAFDSASKLPTGLVKRLKGIQERARIAAENTLPLLQAAQPAYFKKVGFLVESAWRPTVYYRKISTSSRWPPGGAPTSLAEKDSDQCIQELHDSLAQNENTDFRSSCRFSNKCIEYMIHSKQTYGYGILHQILYIQIVQKLGCLSALNGLLIRNGTNAYQLTAELCSNVHAELTRQLEESQHFQSLASFNADLFCEQVFVCSNVGYMEFANISYLHHILSWQRPAGCFRHPEASNQRHLLYSVSLQDGCSSHMTAVALGALSAYLRLFLDFNIQMYFPDLPSFPRLIIEERNEIQRRNLPRLIDERDALEAERRRSKTDENFRPLWPGRTRRAAPVHPAGRSLEERHVDPPPIDLPDSRSFSYLRTLLNWMFVLSLSMVAYVLVRKGYFIRLLAFLYRRRHAPFHNV